MIDTWYKFYIHTRPHIQNQSEVDQKHQHNLEVVNDNILYLLSNTNQSSVKQHCIVCSYLYVNLYCMSSTILVCVVKIPQWVFSSIFTSWQSGCQSDIYTSFIHFRVSFFGHCLTEVVVIFALHKFQWSKVLLKLSFGQILHNDMASLMWYTIHRCSVINSALGWSHYLPIWHTTGEGVWQHCNV